MLTDEQKYNRLATLPCEKHIMSGARHQTIVLNYLGAELCSKHKIYSRGKVQTTMHTITAAGNALIETKFKNI